MAGENGRETVYHLHRFWTSNFRHLAFTFLIDGMTEELQIYIDLIACRIEIDSQILKWLNIPWNVYCYISRFRMVMWFPSLKIFLKFSIYFHKGNRRTKWIKSIKTDFCSIACSRFFAPRHIVWKHRKLCTQKAIPVSLECWLTFFTLTMRVKTVALQEYSSQTVFD